MASRDDYIHQRVIYLTSKPAFRKAIADIRSTYGLPSDGFQSEEALETWRETNIYGKWVDADADTEDSIDLAVARIVNNPTFGISAAWHNFVKQYTLLNKATPPNSIGTKVSTDDVTGQPIIWVAVSEDTSKQDYIDEWKNIEKMREVWELGSPTKRRLADSFILNRKAYAYQIWLDRGSYEEAAKAVEEHFAEELSESAYTADDAKTDIQNFIKQAGI